jgi:hypothetical protein
VSYWQSMGEWILGNPLPFDDQNAPEVSSNEHCSSQVSGKQIDWIELPSSGGEYGGPQRAVGTTPAVRGREPFGRAS